ncbi:MAG TPA: glycosyltransferase family 39 protein [Rhodanobacteraceae bacterium]
MRDGSVAARRDGWRAAFVAVFGIELILKVAIAATLAPFVDEAFYWLESRHLAWGYSDLPGMTAWLIRLGEDVAGHGLIGMRWPFLLIGAALPWIVAAMARRHFGARAGWQAGLVCMALPLAGMLGVLALPDVPLTVAIAVAMYALDRAMDGNRWRDWLLLGVALALAWMTHYRAGMLVLAGLLLMLVTPRGRAQWRRGGFWLAMGIGVLGLVPLIVSNLELSGAGLAFQLVDRNPWRFHANTLIEPIVQAVAVTPLLYALLLWALWQCLRQHRRECARARQPDADTSQDPFARRRAPAPANTGTSPQPLWERACARLRLHHACGQGPWDVLVVMAATFLVGYFVFGLFADDTHFRAHWPLPGYLPLAVALPALLVGKWQCRSWKIWLIAAFALAGAGQLVGYAYLGATAAGGQALATLDRLKAFPVNFTGWRASAAETQKLLQRMPADTVLVADNFIDGAELAFQLDDARPVYVLDSPLNAKHGRAAQLAVWRLDETGLRARQAGRPALLVVDEWILRAHQRPRWLGSLCSRLAGPRFLAREDLYGGRRRFAFYAARVPAKRLLPMPRDDCAVWRQAYAAEQRLRKRGRG